MLKFDLWKLQFGLESSWTLIRIMFTRMCCCIVHCWNMYTKHIHVNTYVLAHNFLCLILLAQDNFTIQRKIFHQDYHLIKSSDWRGSLFDDLLISSDWLQMGEWLMNEDVFGPITLLGGTEGCRLFLWELLFQLKILYIIKLLLLIETSCVFIFYAYFSTQTLQFIF